MAGSRPKLLLTHGEDAARQALAKAVEQRFRLKPLLPAERETIEL